jgi:hypothetical protein
MTLGPLFLEEDNMLKELLKGIVVNDQRADNEQIGRLVQVWFGQPDVELRDQTYPYITIDLIDILEDRARSHRGKVDKTTAPYLQPANFPVNKNWQIDYPIPVNLDYQVTTYARHPRHDRAILSELLYSRLKFRFATLLGNDDTYRRLDVLDVSKRDIVEQAKRLFINAITVRISSEIAQDMYEEFYKVQKVKVTGSEPAPRQRIIGVNYEQTSR